jgi:hypothetical protein
MLYPQYDNKFEKTITPYICEAIQKAAKEQLAEDGTHGYYAHPNVRAHWESIVAGNVPFGYSVKDD